MGPIEVENIKLKATGSERSLFVLGDEVNVDWWCRRSAGVPDKAEPALQCHGRAQQSAQ